MAARAIFKAALSFDDVRVPVKLYSAVRDQRVHFRLLHAPDHQPLSQEMVHTRTGKSVPREEIRRGYPVETDRYVVLTEDELASLEPEADRVIAVEHFVPSSEVAHPWLDRPYFLGPDGSDEAYFALAEALAELDQIGIVRWTMRKQRYVGALMPQPPYLMLVRLHHAGEVVLASSLEAPSGPKLDEKQIELASQLVETLRGHFDPNELEERYQSKVRALVQAKAAGKKVERLEPARPVETDDMARALRESIARAKRQKDKRVA